MTSNLVRRATTEYDAKVCTWFRDVKNKWYTSLCYRQAPAVDLRRPDRSTKRCRPCASREKAIRALPPHCPILR